MSDLPQGWAISSLGDVAGKGQYGWTTKASSSGSVKFLRTTDITKREVIWTNVPFCEETPENLAKFILKKGDVVISRAGSVGFSKLLTSVPGMAVFASYLIRFRASKAIEPKFLAAYLKSDEYWKGIKAASAGIALANVNAASLGKLSIPVPPLGEQTRIANQLDTLFTRIQACNDRLNAIPALLKRFRQTVLAAAVSGRLTKDLRSEDSVTTDSTTSSLWRIPASWRWVRADEVTGFITKGTTPSKEKMTSGSGEVPYIKVYNLGFDGRLDFSVDPTFVDSRTHGVDLKRSITLPGDVLMNIVGPPLGKVAIVPDSHQEWNINQAIARFRPAHGLRSQYLAHCLMSTELISYAVSQAKATVGQLNLTLEICRALPIPIPPEKEQTEIVRRVEALFAMADRIEARCTAARTQAQRLTPLVLAKAFRGELVPQDPNDEPASALLARIASSNTAVADKNKQKVPVALKKRAQAAIKL